MEAGTKKVITVEVIVLLMAIAIIVYFLALGIRYSHAETFRDSMGRVTGTATTRGNVTTFTDNMGREQGYAERRGNTTTITDRMGRERGTITGGKR